jgi:hypothetical protein
LGLRGRRERAWGTRGSRGRDAVGCWFFRRRGYRALTEFGALPGAIGAVSPFRAPPDLRSCRRRNGSKGSYSVPAGRPPLQSSSSSE